MTTQTAPTSTRIEVNGLTLHYLDWGSPRDGATPLVLLHGLTGASGGWGRVADHFRDRYHVVALDQRGHGESDRPAPEGYTTDDYVADLEGFVDALGFDRFVLAGHSMGGHHTIAYAARHPDRVICALANDIPPRFEHNPQQTAAAMQDGQHPVFPTLEAYLDARRPMATFTPEPLLRFYAEAVTRPVDGGVQMRADPNASLRWQPRDLWEEAKTITRPILFIRGGRSQVLDAETLMTMDLAIGPARSITLEKSGHNTFLDMEHEWLDVASAFFAAHER